MAGISCSSMWWRFRGELLLFWIIITVPSSLLQPPLPLSLPVQMSVIPPPWQFLPLFQVEPGPLFSNCSPFSFSQSVFLLPPPGQAHRPGLQASFGPYSVTQLISEPLLHSFPTVYSSLLSEDVERERDEGGQERFRVRVLFQEKEYISTQGTCIILHAFKETEQHKASCVTQPPLGLCVVTLTLPSDWFKDQSQHINQSRQDLDQWHKNVHRNRKVTTRDRGHHHRRRGDLLKHQHAMSSSLRSKSNVDDNSHMDAPRALRYQRGPMQNQIQLYYSSFHLLDDLKPTQGRCSEDSMAQSQSQLFYIRAVTVKEQKTRNQGQDQDRTEKENCLNGQQEDELIVDSHVVIRYHRGPVLIGQPIRVSINLRANFSADFVIIRMKVKKGLVSMAAQRTFTSDLWTVTLERSQGFKHDVMSIFCHKQITAKTDHNFSLLQQVVCLSIDGLRRSFGVAMTVSANWWVEYSGHSKHYGTAVSLYSFVDRHIFGIVPTTESKMIINTAILTNQPVSIPVTVLAISHDEKVSDVTSAVTCHSASENTIKVSSDCSILFVDGSESGLGSTCAMVEFQLGVLSGSVCLEVWAPSVPLQVLLADPVLDAIDGWNLFTEEGCVPVYQRSSVQILTQFTAQDSLGRTKHLLGSSDWFVDVTELVHNWLRIEDPKVASLGPQNILIGLRPGKTSLHVVSEQWDGVLGRCEVTVTSDAVTPGDLSVQVVSGLGMSVTANPGHPAIVTTTVTAYNILYNLHQEASISVWLQFSDDTASLLSSYSDLPFFMRLSSLAETVVMVTSSPEQQIYAQGDGGGPLVQAELLVSTCDDQLISSNSISDNKLPFSALSNRGGASRRLARGSGWVRVNLDLGFARPVGKKNEEDEEFEFVISDMLFGADNDMYVSNEDESGNMSSGSINYEKVKGETANRRWNKDNSQWIVGGNTLERAVLLPSMEEGTVYFSPSHEVEGERREEEEKDGLGAPEFEVGLGAILSLFCLSAVLFLVNCLPCALRDRRRSRTKTETTRDLEDRDPEGGDPEGGDPVAGAPEGGDPVAGDPEAGDPEDGDPDDGDPEAGDPEAGDPEDGDPDDGDPEAGDPEAGDPEDGDPDDGDPEAGGLEDGNPEEGDPEDKATENQDNRGEKEEEHCERKITESEYELKETQPENDAGDEKQEEIIC
ncbi:transmembrane protein 132D [Melanotaenia boesemani]|uniref:transmembrane protein 132D n=1 Tax=Melanotaenia boesemani TaxID=1250792 RepID=UPI001C0555E3|nr:transmembrane protein 132D [Melanotaenia boesemani]